jgi:hypothetical protein
MRTPIVAAIVLIGLVMFSGCGTMKKDRMADVLHVSTNNYREALRWGYYEAAIDFLHPDARDDIDMETLENVRVTGIEEVRPGVITPENKVARTVRIDYVLEDEQRVKQVVDRQDWRWDADRQAWWLHSGLPDF